jgi:hypothetical protein
MLLAMRKKVDKIFQDPTGERGQTWKRRKDKKGKNIEVAPGFEPGLPEG